MVKSGSSGTGVSASGVNEWIVQARLPERRVKVIRAPLGGPARLAGIISADSSGDVRDARLAELYKYLYGVLSTRPVLLKAAGAVSIRASAEEVELIAKHPLVKDIQPNRRKRLGR